MRAEVTSWTSLRFDDGTPVRAASAIARLGPGWLVAQDDATHGAWWTPSSVQRLRLFPPVDGFDLFEPGDGTKALKPDLEAACEVDVDGVPGVLALGSGSTPRRMRAALVLDAPGGVQVLVADLSPLYDAAAQALGLPDDQINFEGACRVGPALRWFNRGNQRAGVDSMSVDVDLATLVRSVVAGGDVGRVVVRNPLRYALGEVDGVGLTVTDAVVVGNGQILLSAAAEDTPNAVDDGPVVAAALALLEGDRVAAIAPLAGPDLPAPKVEGLALRHTGADALSLLAVVDDDDPQAASVGLEVRVAWS